MLKSTWLFVAAVLCMPASLLAQSPAAVKTAVSSITPADIQHGIEVIAHDSMRGRDTPSPGLRLTAEYVGNAFRRFGLAPGGDSGTFLQWYPLKQSELDTTASTLLASSGDRLRVGADAVPLFLTSNEITVSGPVVVLSSSVTVEEMRAAGLAGKIVALIPPTAPTSTRPQGSVMRSLSGLVNERPAAILMPNAADNATWRSAVRQQLRPSVSPGWAEDDPGDGLAFLSVREPALRALLVKHEVDYRAVQAGQIAKPAPVKGLTMTITIKRRVGTEVRAPNVVGILPGSDPALRNEYIVFSAHMDHVGVGSPSAQGDSIRNGADDDASGTIGVVELAEAFSKLNPAPRRSLVFLTVSGEEKGLWGSDFFASHSPVPVKDIVANLNMDMIGRNWKDTIVVIGKEHSDLGATLNRVNQAHPELGMTAIDDIWPQENFYRRSDHFNFARKGVPILFFFNGTHPDYHQPSDEAHLIDAEKESRIVKLVFYLGLEVASTAERPKWNPESYRSVVEPLVP